MSEVGVVTAQVPGAHAGAEPVIGRCGPQARSTTPDAAPSGCTDEGVRADAAVVVAGGAG